MQENDQVSSEKEDFISIEEKEERKGYVKEVRKGKRPNHKTPKKRNEREREREREEGKFYYHKQQDNHSLPSIWSIFTKSIEDIELHFSFCRSIQIDFIRIES